MSAAVHVNHLVRNRAPREGHLARMRVRARRSTLDRRLARGDDPTTDPDLARRAAQLIEPKNRRRIAMVLDRILEEAAGPPAPFSSKVPLARTAIIACAPRICEIAGRIEGEGPVTVRGIALATVLVHRGDSPLFSTPITDTALNHHLAQIIDALGGA